MVPGFRFNVLSGLRSTGLGLRSKGERLLSKARTQSHTQMTMGLAKPSLRNPKPSRLDYATSVDSVKSHTVGKLKQDDQCWCSVWFS